MKFATAAACGLLIFSCLSASATLAVAGPEGTWVSEDGGLKVRITECGGNRLCGTVIWLGEPNDPSTGRPKTDIHNPDPAKRARPLIGLRVAQGLRPSGPNEWSGFVYNADDGHVYQGHLLMQDPDTVRMKGCVADGLCLAHTWTRSSVVARNIAR